MKAVLDAIYLEFAPAGAKPNFYDDMSGRLRLHEARQNETFPYCVYALIGVGNDQFFGQQYHESLTIQFNIFDQDSSAVSVNNYYENLKTLYDDCDLTVSGWTHLWMERNWGYLLRDEQENVWQYAVQYRVLIEK